MVSCCLGGLITAVAQAAAPDAHFATLYDYYFPKRASDLRSDYRRSFDRLLTAEGLALKTNDRMGIFARAVQGDPAAVHRFFHSRDRDGEGEFTEAWSYQCPLLLMRLGDVRFAGLLEKEGSTTREAVGATLENMIDWRRHSFPLTRGLYAARKLRASAELVARRQSPACAPIALTAREEAILRRALSAQPRYLEVSLTIPRRLLPAVRGQALVYVWSRYSEAQLAGLAEFIRHSLNRSSPIHFASRRSGGGN